MSGLRRVSMCWAMAVLSACGPRAAEDAGAAMDASPDAARLDASHDAAPADASGLDASGLDASGSPDARVPGLDGSVTDGGRRDDGSVFVDGGGPCIPISERCDGADDDCDGTIDEDPVDCARPGAVTECVSGACRVIACDAPLADCDGDPANGCEARLDTVAACGACGASCAPANATPACVSGACAIAACNPGWDDCDAISLNGCETSLSTIESCGACGTICAPAHATAACPSGACAVGACDAGFGDCDGDASNGCESPLDRIESCGACGVRCAPAHATPSCDGTSCRIDACSAGYADCDLDPATGCEANLTTNTTCGDCATRCGPVPGGATFCRGGRCDLTCGLDLGDCDGVAANGCEQSLREPAHCGACGRTCAPGLECRAGGCVPTRWRRLSAGTNHTCVLRSTGEVWCWGYGYEGQLGDGRVVDDYRLVHDLTPTPVRALVSDVVALSVSGSNTTCGILRDRRVSCWGGLDLPGSFDRATSRPEIIPGLSDVVELYSSSMVHAVHASGRVTRWEYGGTSSEWGIYDAASINGGFVVRRSGYGLSAGWYGVEPTLTSVGTYRTIVDLEHAVRGANGGSAHNSSCAVHSDGRVSCWGRQPSGGVILRPQARTDISDAIDVTIGHRHTCVLHGDRTVSCWGDNDVGQLGNGTLIDSPTAVPVPGLTNIVEISAGQHHTCARRSDEAILCWGSNGYSQIARVTDFPCRPEVDSWMCPTFSSPTLVLGLP